MRSLRFLTVLTGVVTAGLLVAGPASAGTAPASHQHSLKGSTSVTTAPGIAAALLSEGVVPLPVSKTGFKIGFTGGLSATYRFSITGGDPSLSPAGGDIYHSGGIDFVSASGKYLEIGDFDISLNTGKIYATQVDFATARIPVLDLGLSGLKVTHHGDETILTGITLRLDPVAAGALDSTFHLALPTDGSLVFGSATVILRS